MTDGRRDEPWVRQAARGVGSVVLLAAGVFVVGAAIAALAVLALG